MKNRTSPTGAKHITIVQGHPDGDQPHFCRALAEAYAEGARQAGHSVQTIDVGRLDFPLARCRKDLEETPAPSSIRQAQDALVHSDHIVLIYPVWNGSAPALLRGFLEQTFRAKFVFPGIRPHERLGFSSYFTRRKALAGKTGRIVATMAMPAFMYRWYFHPHLERNTLRVAGSVRFARA